MKYPELPTPNVYGETYNGHDILGYDSSDLYSYAENFHESNMPVIYVDENGSLQSRVSIEQIEAVLGPYIDRIRKQLKEQS